MEVGFMINLPSTTGKDLYYLHASRKSVGGIYESLKSKMATKM